MKWVVDTCVIIELAPSFNGDVREDVVIGALAMENAGLITRNEDDFRSLYPTLNIYNPVKASI